MNSYFLDSSAIVKRYVNETGSDYVSNLTDVKSGNIILVARITYVEIAAALSRRRKAGDLSEDEVPIALSGFQQELDSLFYCIEVTKELIEKAVHLTTTYSLRGYDAVQLAAAVEAHKERTALDLSSLTLVSADLELNRAAKTEGISVYNPDNH